MYHGFASFYRLWCFMRLSCWFRSYGITSIFLRKRRLDFQAPAHTRHVKRVKSVVKILNKFSRGLLITGIIMLLFIGADSGSPLLGLSLTLLLVFYTFYFPADSLIVMAAAVAVRPFLITLNPALKGILD